MTSKAATLILFFLMSVKLVAQDTLLPNVTVTASLLEQEQKETGRNIFSIRGDLFSSFPVHSVDELLRYLPGVEVQQRGPQGAQSNIILRGGTFQQVLVIIDGIRLNDPITGHFNSYIPLHPSEIERIEILKGSASAVYGSEAVGGVINIISKTFYRKNVLGKKSFQAKLATGSYKMINGEINARYANERTILSVGVQTNNADGPALRGTNGYFHLHNTSLAFSTTFKKEWTLQFRTAADLRSFNAQNFFTSFASDTAHEKVRSWWNHLQLKKQTRGGELIWDAGYKKLRDQFWFRPAAIPNDNRSGLFSTQLYYMAASDKKWGYTTGVQLQQKRIRSNDRGNHNRWQAAAYGIFRQQIGKKLFLNQGLRLGWDEGNALILVPQFNMAWSGNRISFRASGGRSFRDADFTERYNNYNKSLVTSGSIGNPWLEPEKAWNLEAGADFQLKKGLQVSSTVFVRRHRNLIDWTPTPYADMPRKENLSPAGTYSLAKNVEEINTSGFELDIQYRHQISTTSSIWTSLGYTWIGSKNEDSIPSFYISSHARHLLNFSSLFTIRSFAISLNGLFKERNSRKAAAINADISPSYFIMGMKMAYSPPKLKGKFFVQADNLFNKRYSDLLGALMPGRWLSGGIEITL